MGQFLRFSNKSSASYGYIARNHLISVSLFEIFPHTKCVLEFCFKESRDQWVNLSEFPQSNGLLLIIEPLFKIVQHVMVVYI